MSKQNTIKKENILPKKIETNQPQVSTLEFNSSQVDLSTTLNTKLQTNVPQTEEQAKNMTFQGYFKVMIKLPFSNESQKKKKTEKETKKQETKKETEEEPDTCLLEIHPYERVVDIVNKLANHPKAWYITNFNFVDSKEKIVPLEKEMHEIAADRTKPQTITTLYVKEKDYTPEQGLGHFLRIKTFLELLSSPLRNKDWGPSLSRFYRLAEENVSVKEKMIELPEVYRVHEELLEKERQKKLKEMEKLKEKENEKEIKKEIKKENEKENEKKTEETKTTMKTEKLQGSRKRKTYTLGDFIFSQPKFSNLIPNEYIQNITLKEPLKKIGYSGWNKPPNFRRIQGDFFYIEVTTQEDDTVFITSCPKGFFINSSTSKNFNFTMKPKTKLSTNLIDLLKSISNTFKETVAAIQKKLGELKEIEISTSDLPRYSWFRPEDHHVYDFSGNYSDELLILYRDWNKEINDVKGMEASSGEKIILREALETKIMNDFVTEAINGSIAIVEKRIRPIDQEDQSSKIFIHRGIFYSYPLEILQQNFKNGGEKATRKVIDNDIQSASHFNRQGISELNPPFMVSVDYHGQRICGQWIPPGLDSPGSNKVIHGSFDSGQTLVENQNILNILKSKQNSLALKLHKIKDKNQKVFEKVLSVESKCIRGHDGRLYIIDFGKTTPRDLNYPDKTKNAQCVLRHELINIFDIWRKTQFLDAKMKQWNKEHTKETDKHNKNIKALVDKINEKKKELYEEIGKSAKQFEELKEKKNNKEIEKAKLKIQEIEKQLNEMTKELKEVENEIIQGQLEVRGKFVKEYDPVKFNVDYSTTANLDVKGEEKNNKENVELIEQINKFLEKTIKEFSEHLINQTLSPPDGEVLSRYMHERGINFRYLGKLATLTTKLKYLNHMIIREMVVRVSKHILNKELRECTLNKKTTLIATFYNYIFGNQSKRRPKKSNIPGITFTHQSIWNKIKKQVYVNFNYKLNLTDKNFLVGNELNMLKSLCKKVGVQVALFDYDFKKIKPFKKSQILNLFPVFKSPPISSRIILGYMEKIKMDLSLGDHMSALKTFETALSIVQAINGMFHVDVATCYSFIAMLISMLNLKAAIKFEKKALMLYERILGVDHPDVASHYITLASFYQRTGKSKTALNLYGRALLLHKLFLGENNPNTLMVMATIANLYIAEGNIDEADKIAEYLIKMNKEIFGEDTVQFANAMRLKSSIFGARGEYKKAIEAENLVFTITKNKTGEESKSTQNSKQLIEHYMQKLLVQNQVNSKELEEKQSKKPQKKTSKK
ncbi:clustered mitochondria protein [Anaeramoeba flamelloides]|uniref:Clustered mitochondria protein n=1 Tax=Anaeramoeba flamelloides TaxID=1746091 RepID=A0AAV8A5G0_9EUKA|nr:clustered mitochondria protein [Anaeramoeba flamelloides]